MNPALALFGVALCALVQVYAVCRVIWRLEAALAEQQHVNRLLHKRVKQLEGETRVISAFEPEASPSPSAPLPSPVAARSSA